MPQGQPLRAGDVYVQSDLARSFEAISRGGIDVFYRGDLARRIGNAYEREGGLLRYDDLAGYYAEETSPIATTYAGLDVYQSAPNSQGIVMLIALNILEGFDLVEMGHNSADYVHVVTEAMKLAFADRNRYVADPKFADVPTDELLQEVWELPPTLNTRTVDTHVKRLRQKLGAAAVLVHTVRGAGYRFSTEET